MNAAGVAEEASSLVERARHVLIDLKRDSDAYALRSERYRDALERQRDDYEEALRAMAVRVDALESAVKTQEEREIEARELARLALQDLAAAERQRDVSIELAQAAEQRAQRAERLLASVVAAVEDEFGGIESAA